MKKLLLTCTALSYVLAAVAQNSPLPISSLKERLARTGNLTTVPYQPAITGDMSPLNGSNETVKNYVSRQNKTSMVQTVIGNTTYDLQSNGSIQNRIYKKNGNVGACWTHSTEFANYTDRGTMYTYYDGSTWNAPLKVENDRRGWPSLIQLANGSEVVVSHNALAIPTATSIRPTAGSGAWTQTPTPSFPGGENTLWVRTAAGGPDGNTVHMIDVSYPIGNLGALVNGLDGCLNYSRSLDGGVNWDIVRALPPGINDQEYLGFRADGYAIDAKDDIVAFTSGNITDDWALWKSTDNGTNWTRTVILDFPFTKYDGLTQITDVDGDGVADTLESTDGSYAILIDNSGMVHCFAGAMLVLDDDPATNTGLFLSTDGLFYWNESMGSNPPVIIATAPDIDGDGVAASFAVGLGGRYGNDGLCSMPSVGIDAAGNIYMSYSPLMETTDSGPPNEFSFRNLFLKSSSDGGTTWTDGYNLSNSFFDEAVFGSMAKNVDNCISIVWQQDGDPGFSVLPNGEHPVTNNDIIYDCVDVALILGVNNVNPSAVTSVSVYPNPVSSNLEVNYTLERTTEMTIEIRNTLGQIVAIQNEKAAPKGTFKVNFDVSKLSSGIYSVNTLIGNEVASTKFVKN